MKLVAFTKTEHGNPIHVNPDHVMALVDVGYGTLLVLSGHALTYTVLESADDVRAKLYAGDDT